MYITYKNKKIQKICTDTKSARKALPDSIKPEILFTVLKELYGFDTMADIPTLPPHRLHKWIGKRKGEWTVDIQGLHRIHFIPVGNFEKMHLEI
ncbi:MAG: killer suppression protein [candidate division Zixibacteria bacterium]|nr:killer suppression protein [Candidatus Tariuqbacter arcticus]